MDKELGPVRSLLPAGSTRTGQPGGAGHAAAGPGQRHPIDDHRGGIRGGDAGHGLPEEAGQQHGHLDAGAPTPPVDGRGVGVDEPKAAHALGDGVPGPRGGEQPAEDHSPQAVEDALLAGGGPVDGEQAPEGDEQGGQRPRRGRGERSGGSWRHGTLLSGE
jgi:hypothetical protein